MVFVHEYITPGGLVKEVLEAAATAAATAAGTKSKFPKHLNRSTPSRTKSG